MEWTLRREIELSFTRLSIAGTRLGDDILLCVAGGDRPHIGCTVQAIPRASLTGDGSVGVTSSVLSLTGHKDEGICRRLAERCAKKYNAVTVCTGGVHVDGISGEQIAEILKAVEEVEL